MPETAQRHRNDTHKNLVGFIVGDVQYAVDIGKVREIVNPLPLTVLPHTPAEVAGVADHRDDVVPVIDLRVRFNLERRGVERGTKWILITIGERVVGLVVDAVTEVFGARSDDIRPTPEVGGKSDVRGISGVARHEGKLTFVLDTARFLEIVEALSATGALDGPAPAPREAPPGAQALRDPAHASQPLREAPPGQPLREAPLGQALREAPLGQALREAPLGPPALRETSGGSKSQTPAPHEAAAVKSRAASSAPLGTARGSKPRSS
jgi:purine-binding chemotaxis protein CheW